MIDPAAVAGQITSGVEMAVVGPNGMSLTDEGGNDGLIMSSSARTNLMAKLGGGAFAQEVQTVVKQEVNPTSAAVPNIYTVDSPCILLKNMFDPSKETDPDFDLDIREDVMEEVGKYGQLRHIYVDKTSKEGLVYLKFTEYNGAKTTMKSSEQPMVWAKSDSRKVHSNATIQYPVSRRELIKL
eukprot:TRINITY_DN1542_c0_g1_i1.p1 TRINITY_DN1542_c0_g1~~TRINITY_DN1542_c0_g1_i1.p1  ORF type:complete len:197 (-),score=43.11 TRINITY_DN1542_c0_g1_i1:196-744(-)